MGVGLEAMEGVYEGVRGLKEMMRGMGRLSVNLFRVETSPDCCAVPLCGDIAPMVIGESRRATVPSDDGHMTDESSAYDVDGPHSLSLPQTFFLCHEEGQARQEIHQSHANPHLLSAFQGRLHAGCYDEVQD